MVQEYGADCQIHASMKLSLLTDGITPYVTGGMQKHSYCLARYFALQGVDIDLYHDYGSLFSRKEVDELSVFSPSEKEHINGIAFDFPPPGKLPGHYLRRSKSFAKMLREAFLEQPLPDFIVAKGFTPWSLLDDRPANCPPIGVKFHGMNMFQTLTGTRGKLEAAMFRPVVRKLMRSSDYVFSYGGRITEIIEEQGVPLEQILEFPSGIESDWLERSEREMEEVRFIYVGRYERLKGIEELYTAIRTLPADLNTSFSFVGPIPEDKRMDHPRVKYYGQVSSRQDLRAIYQEHDVLVSTSYSEGMPNAILEAMGLGLTTFSTDTGAVRALVNEKTGWLIESPPDPERIAAVLQEIVSDKTEIEQRKASAFDHIDKNFRWETIISQMKQRIEGLIK